MFITFNLCSLLTFWMVSELLNILNKVRFDPWLWIRNCWRVSQGVRTLHPFQIQEAPTSHLDPLSNLQSNIQYYRQRCHFYFGLYTKFPGGKSQFPLMVFFCQFVTHSRSLGHWPNGWLNRPPKGKRCGAILPKVVELPEAFGCWCQPIRILMSV